MLYIIYYHIYIYRRGVWSAITLRSSFRARAQKGHFKINPPSNSLLFPVPHHGSGRVLQKITIVRSGGGTGGAAPPAKR